MALEDIGSRLRVKRNIKKLSQAEFADSVNISTDYVSKLERGHRIPSLPTLIQMLNVLELSADEVMPDVINKSYLSRASEYLDQIGKLPKKEQERILSMIELLLYEHENN